LTGVTPLFLKKINISGVSFICVSIKKSTSLAFKEGEMFLSSVAVGAKLNTI